MNTCSTCFYWPKPERPYKVNKLDRVEHYRLCHNPKLNFKGSYDFPSKAKSMPKSFAGPAFENEDALCMVCGPEFGCIHWTKK
jgi:hypothetical protein